MVAAFAGWIYFGSANKGAVQSNETETAGDEASEPDFVPESESASELKTAFSAEEVAALNLIPSELPPHYIYREEKSGPTDDPLLYADGDPLGTQWLKETGWQAAHEAYFETEERPELPVSSIHATLSVYEDASRMSCIFQELGNRFVLQGGSQIPTSRKFGDESFLFLTYLEEPGVGRFPALQLRFYYGNAFANLEAAGPEGAISPEELESYATLVEQRLKEACPNCDRAPACPA